MGSDHENEVKKPRPSRRRSEDIGEEDEIVQRSRINNCPVYCNKFKCMLEDNCNEECEKLDMAKALICELCANPCETEKQKILMLDFKYYDQKKKEFSKTVLDGVHEIKQRHTYLETRYLELKRAMMETPFWNIWKKKEIAMEGKKIKYELQLLRQFMDWLEMSYKKEVEFEENNG